MEANNTQVKEMKMHRKLTVGEMLYYQSDDSPEAARIREEKAKQRKARAKAARAAKRAAYESCGMVRVRGALGGTYYE